MNKIFSPVKICLFLLALNTPSFADVTTPPSDMFVRLASNGKLYVQAGAFKSAENANNYRQKLSQLTTHSVIIKPDATYHRVWIGPLDSIQSARALRMALLNPAAETTQTIMTTMQAPSKHKNSAPLSYVATVSAGPAWFDKGNKQAFYVQPMTERAYVPSDTNTPAIVEVFTGVRHPFTPKLDSQWGITAVTSSNLNYKGGIWDDALPQFYNFNYAYDIQHIHIGLKGKLLRDVGYRLAPYVSGSVALAFNEAKNFTNMPLIPEAVVQPNFQSNTTTAFAYTVGAGLQANIYQHWYFGVGYEFADWGKARLARSFEQTLGSGLSIANLYINQLQFSLSYYT
ncbi:MAG: SPOR domain-containing protein [Legionellaceae bacterium]|nr:SPOR domain-containing protein [Legionellaceae bacterium]